MKYTVVVFKSRTDTMRFYNIIKRHGSFCSIINTPRILISSCGISVKISGASVNIARQIISANNFSSFFGIYDINIVNSKETPTRIY